MATECQNICNAHDCLRHHIGGVA